MEKLDLQSPDLVNENFQKIAELFPNCVTETAEGKAIDFDLLKQELNHDVVEGNKERYRLEWPGKRESIVTANLPTTKTLRPVKDESVDFDTTENLYIEGDNLEVLKLLQESYLGKVKMIYIDPPYNTGKDFVYKDNFSQSAEEYKEESGQVDENKMRLFVNPETAGRYHSDWLSMMYPRLKLARNLLTEDGVIFISIDDNEVHNLRKVCDEIFGEGNFVVQVIWKKRSTPPNDKIIGAIHEYIVVYIKDNTHYKNAFNLKSRNEEQLSRYKNPDNHPKGVWTAGDLMANVKGGRYVESLYFPIINPETKQEHYPSSNGNWRFNRKKIEELIKNNEIYFGDDGIGRPKLKRFLSEIKDGITYGTIWNEIAFNQKGSKEISNILGNMTIFDNPKPIELVQELSKLGSNPNSIILDFFSGSASTAHAVMQLNSEDASTGSATGKRKFIMVQIPETTDEKSEAYKAGYKNICEIGKERIRRAGKKIKEGLVGSEPPTKDGQDTLGFSSPDQDCRVTLDTGFRVLRLDSSNLQDVYYKPHEFKQEELDLFSDNIKDDRTPEDILFQILLDWGLPLSLNIQHKTILGKKVFLVEENSLYACFDKGIDEDFAREVAKEKPLRIVFRDSGFKDDTAKTNVQQLFKQLSPETEVKVF